MALLYTLKLTAFILAKKKIFVSLNNIQGKEKGEYCTLILLTGTLISRMFGQKKNGTDSSANPNSMTVAEFSAHYPELCPLIVTKLEEVRKACVHSVAQLPPVLFPILTILSHLAPQTETNR